MGATKAMNFIRRTLNLGVLVGLSGPSRNCITSVCFTAPVNLVVTFRPSLDGGGAKRQHFHIYS
jgi:hypothetical protein